MIIMIKPKQSMMGFTLIELVVAIAVAAILITLGIPSMREMLRSSQRQQISTGIFLALNQARYEAISRNTNVVMASGSYNDANNTWTTGTSWNQGWAVFTDQNGNGQFDPANDVVLSESDPISTAFTIQDSISNNFSVSFRSSGRVTSARILTLCGSSQNDSRRIEASAAGAITLYNLADFSATAYAAACPS